MQRPIHPADFVKQVMSERGITADDLLAAGCDPEWTAAIMRRQDELPTRDRRMRNTMVALTKATGIPMQVWARVQETWFQHAKQVAVQRMRRIDAQRANAEQQWREIANRGPAPGPNNRGNGDE